MEECPKGQLPKYVGANSQPRGQLVGPISGTTEGHHFFSIIFDVSASSVPTSAASARRTAQTQTFAPFDFWKLFWIRVSFSCLPGRSRVMFQAWAWTRPCELENPRHLLSKLAQQTHVSRDTQQICYYSILGPIATPSLYKLPVRPHKPK